VQSLKFVVGEFDVGEARAVVDLRGSVGTTNRGRHHGLWLQQRPGDRGAGKAWRRGGSADGAMMVRSAGGPVAV